MAGTKISELTELTTPTGEEELVYAKDGQNGKIKVKDLGKVKNIGGIYEFVETKNITGGNYSTETIGSYNYDTYMIAKETTNTGTLFTICIPSGNSYAPSPSYGLRLGISDLYIKSGYNAYIYKNSPTAMNFTVYVFKLSLPS